MEKVLHPLLSEQHHQLRAKVRKFANEEIKPVAQELDKNAHTPASLLKKMGDLGLFGICIPKKYGGMELDTLSYIIAVEELARVDSSQAATIAAHNSLGVTPINTYGTEAQKEKFLPKLTTGDKLWAFGLTEPTAGSDAMGVKTTAEDKGDHWLINGFKKFITNAASDVSSGITLQAITGESNGKKELSAILVDREETGYTAEPLKEKMVWRAVDTGQLTFDNIKVSKDCLLGEKGKGAKVMLQTLDGGRLSIAAIGLGLAEGALERSLEHVKSREQFGKPLVAFQAIRFKIANMHVKIETARNTLYKVCWQKDQGLPFTKDAAIAKYYCSEIAKEVADAAVQIHGARGLFNEYDIERFYRDQRILQIGEGTSEILQHVIAREISK